MRELVGSAVEVAGVGLAGDGAYGVNRLFIGVKTAI